MLVDDIRFCVEFINNIFEFIFENKGQVILNFVMYICEDLL